MWKYLNERLFQTYNLYQTKQKALQIAKLKTRRYSIKKIWLEKSKTINIEKDLIVKIIEGL